MNANAILRPTAGFMLAHPARFIALGFGTGLSPFAPGTVGTLLGFPMYWIASGWLAPYGPLGCLRSSRPCSCSACGPAGAPGATWG